MTTTKYKGWYGKTSDGILVRVVNEGISKDREGNEVEAYKVEYCTLGRSFAGGGMLVGTPIVGTGRFAWMRKSGITKMRKGQRGVIWNN